MGQLPFRSGWPEQQSLRHQVSGPRRGQEWGAAKLSVSVLRAERLHVKTQRANSVCPGLSQAPALNWKGGGQRTMGHSFCPTSWDRGTERWVSPVFIAAQTTCLSWIYSSLIPMGFESRDGRFLLQRSAQRAGMGEGR